MLKPRERMSKKDLKEDKLVIYYGKAMNLLDEYSRYVYLGAAALIIIIAAFMFFSNQTICKR